MFYPYVLPLLLLLLPQLLSVLCLDREVAFLRQVKRQLDDPDGFLSSWEEKGDVSACKWYGVTCGADGSVTGVDLNNTNVAGPFPLPLCLLPKLSFISFYNNSINGSLSGDISDCRSLVHLDLSQNYLVGTLPASLADLPNLRHLDVSANNFSGEVPSSFGWFRRLEAISLVYNLFHGRFPAMLTNVSTLRQLNLSFNPFIPGPLPAQLVNLTNLEILWVSECNLVGRIPDSLGRLKKLTDFDVTMNRLEGPIPSSLTELSSAVQIELWNNSLTGMLPPGMSNLTNLRLFDASMNRLGGPIPDELCRLPLGSLNLYENEFEGEFPASIASSENLFELRLFRNRLTGELPKTLGKKGALEFVDASFNMFSGEIPGSLCDGGVLGALMLVNNSFSGPLPASLADCRTLTRVRFGFNQLSGPIPTGFWGLPRVRFLELVGNSFTGEISASIGFASKLSSLRLSNNNFTGIIPEEIGLLRNLIDFSGNCNQFTGGLPSSILNLTQLGKLDLQGNKLSGGIPVGIHSLRRLNELNLAKNEFSGRIPDEIGSLSSLNYLDLSQNRFSGKIPLQLQNLKLNWLNLSYNVLSGDIPPLYAKPMYKDSFLGNPGLCGSIEGLCNEKSGGKNQGYVLLLKSIFVLAALVLLVGVTWFYLRYRSFKKARGATDKTKWTIMSFHKLNFSELEILDCLDEDNMIGSGVSGKVYKAVLSNGEAIAVKKLWGQSKSLNGEEGGDRSDKDDGFEAEVKTLGKIRHKNIVKLWCCCTAKDSKLLVYEYMQNGSLGDLLHSNKGGLLDWPTRYKIAVDAAEGLSYLHHDCVPPIVHRDVKSNNILLDADFGARVADFGVAKVVDPAAGGPKSMSLVVGSRGYIAPEYAYTLRINEKSDIYSFGVVILELVTGRHPIDPEFGEKDLVKWVCTSLDKKGAEGVLDPKLDARFKEEVRKVLHVGLACTNPLPINRPAMRRVVKMLLEVGGAEHQIKAAAAKDGKFSPYYYEDGSENGSVV